MNILLHKNIYRKFTINAYFDTNAEIFNNTISVKFDKNPVVGDFIGIYRYDGVEIAEITEVNGNLLTVDDSLVNDTFGGYLLLIRPSKAFKDLQTKITDYQTQHPSDGMQSESITGYSYTKSADGIKGWSAVFATELSQYIDSLPMDFGRWIGGVKGVT